LAGERREGEATSAELLGDSEKMCSTCIIEGELEALSGALYTLLCYLASANTGWKCLSEWKKERALRPEAIVFICVCVCVCVSSSGPRKEHRAA